MIQEVGHGSIPVLIAPSHREGVRSKSGLSFWKPSFRLSYPHTQTLPLSATENPSIPLLCTRSWPHGQLIYRALIFPREARERALVFQQADLG